MHNTTHELTDEQRAGILRSPFPPPVRRSTLRHRTGADRPAFFFGDTAGRAQRALDPMLDRMFPLTHRLFMSVIDMGGPLDACEHLPAGSTRRYGYESDPFTSQRTITR